jgi:hypothetical protein
MVLPPTKSDYCLAFIHYMPLRDTTEKENAPIVIFAIIAIILLLDRPNPGWSRRPLSNV